MVPTNPSTSDSCLLAPPSELLHMITELLCYDRLTLKTLCCTCHHLMAFGKPVLYTTLVLKARRLDVVFSTLNNNHHLANSVKHLTIQLTPLYLNSTDISMPHLARCETLCLESENCQCVSPTCTCESLNVSLCTILRWTAQMPYLKSLTCSGLTYIIDASDDDPTVEGIPRVHNIPQVPPTLTSLTLALWNNIDSDDGELLRELCEPWLRSLTLSSRHRPHRSSHFTEFGISEQDMLALRPLGTFVKELRLLDCEHSGTRAYPNIPRTFPHLERLHFKAIPAKTTYSIPHQELEELSITVESSLRFNGANAAKDLADTIRHKASFPKLRSFKLQYDNAGRPCREKIQAKNYQSALREACLYADVVFVSNGEST